MYLQRIRSSKFMEFRQLLELPLKIASLNNFGDCNIPLVIDTRRHYLSGMPIISKVDISMSITSSMWLCLTFRYPCLEATSSCARLANQTFMFPPVEAGEVILISLNLASTHRMRTKDRPLEVHQWGDRPSNFLGVALLRDNIILVLMRDHLNYAWQSHLIVCKF